MLNGKDDIAKKSLFELIDKFQNIGLAPIDTINKMVPHPEGFCREIKSALVLVFMGWQIKIGIWPD